MWNLGNGVQISNEWRDDDDDDGGGGGGGGGDRRDAGVLTIALSPNGKTVASGSLDGKVRLWDVEKKKVVAKLTGHTDVVRSLCWSVDGERVVSGSNDTTIRVWDVESGDTVLGPINTGHYFVCAVIYSPDTTKIATGGYNDNALKIWDVKTGNLLSTIKHDDEVRSLAWTSDHKKIITGSEEGSIRIFDTATWQQMAILEGHTSIVLSLCLFQSDCLLASASYDGKARLWNLDTNLPVGPPIQHVHEGPVPGAVVNSVAISADGKQLVTGCNDNNAYVWDIHTTLKDAGLEGLLSIHDVSVNASTSVPSQH